MADNQTDDEEDEGEEEEEKSAKDRYPEDQGNRKGDTETPRSKALDSGRMVKLIATLG